MEVAVIAETPKSAPCYVLDTVGSPRLAAYEKIFEDEVAAHQQEIAQIYLDDANRCCLANFNADFLRFCDPFCFLLCCLLNRFSLRII